MNQTTHMWLINAVIQLVLDSSSRPTDLRERVSTVADLYVLKTFHEHSLISGVTYRERGGASKVIFNAIFGAPLHMGVE